MPMPAPFFIFVGFVIICVVVYFIGWLYCCLRSSARQNDVDFELGEIQRCMVKKPERANEAFFLSYGESSCCVLSKPKSTNQCIKNPYCVCKLLIKIKSSICSAKRSICVAMFNFNNGELCNYILNVNRNSNISIRILVDKSSCTEGKNKQAKRLMDAGISVRVAGDSSDNDELASGGDKLVSTNSLMHNKFCIIDGENDVGVLITGSLIWTFSALSRHAENVVFLYEDQIRKDFLTFFNHLWRPATKLDEFINPLETSA